MHEASELFKKAISQPNRDLRIRVTIDGREYSGTEVQDCNIEESVLSGEEFKFGSSTSSTFDLTLLNMDESLSAKSFEGKEVHIEIGAVLDKFNRPLEFVSMGSFIVEKATKEDNLIRMNGFDGMILFEKPYISNLTYPATLRKITEEICVLAGVPLEDKPFLNENYVVQNKPDTEEMSLRTALEHVSEIACSFARVNRKKKLEFVSLTDTPVVIDQSNYYSMNLSEYEYGPINRVVVNNDGVIESVGEGSNILEIKDNIYALNPSAELLNNIYGVVKNFKFKPFTATWQGNVLTSPGDLINVKYKNGDKYKTFIAKQKFNFSNGLTCDLETNAKTQVQVDYQTKGSITNEIKKVKSSIEVLDEEIKLEVEAINESIASINLRADEIVLSVKSLDGRMESAESSITLQAGQIELKVSRDGVISSINQSPEAITLNASRINMLGITEVANELHIGGDWRDSTSKALFFRGRTGGVAIASPQMDSLSLQSSWLAMDSNYVRFMWGSTVDFTGVNVIGLS